MRGKIGLIFVLSGACAPLAISQPEAGRTFPVKCDKVSDAATAYLQSRGVQLSDRSKGDLCAKVYQCFSLQLAHLSGKSGEPLDWNQIREQYTKVGAQRRPNDEKRTWSGGHGAWATADKWRAAGGLWFRQDRDGCFMKLDLSYGRRVTQYLVFFPMDLSFDSLGSNGRLEQEAFAGTERELARSH